MTSEDLDDWRRKASTNSSQLRGVKPGPAGLKRSCPPSALVTMILARVSSASRTGVALRPACRRPCSSSSPFLPPAGKSRCGRQPKCCNQRATLTPLPPGQRRSCRIVFFSSHRTESTRHSTSMDGFSATTRMLGRRFTNRAGTLESARAMELNASRPLRLLAKVEKHFTRFRYCQNAFLFAVGVIGGPNRRGIAIAKIDPVTGLFRNGRCQSDFYPALLNTVLECAEAADVSGMSENAPGVMLETVPLFEEVITAMVTDLFDHFAMADANF